MRGMGEIPWPTRRFKYPPTFGTTLGVLHVGSCKRQVSERQVRRGKLRRKATEQIACGGRVFLQRSRMGKRRVYCESCRARGQQRREIRNLEQRLRRFGALTPRQQIREERRAVRALSRLRRVGR